MTMRERLSLITAGAVVLLVLAPIFIVQLTPEEARTLRGVDLKDTTFQEVAFYNDVQGLDLTGLLFLPDGEGPFPAVVVIHGSGSSHRDNPWYLTFVSYLQSQGIAVLLPDKRGSESSAGDWRAASFEDLATDTLSAISYLQTEYPDAISAIGILGASQGGQIAPIVASRSSDVAFVVNVVGAAVPLHRVLVYEENHNLREMGVLPGLSNAIARLSSFYIRRVAQREFWDAVGDFDPLPYWADVDVPALVLYGELDTNVPSQASAERLATLEKPNVSVVTFEGSGHSLEDPVGMGNSYFRWDALALIRDSIAEATAGR
jgi:dipeptidyl aminopeptidase/acylaminoacyl peptidase